MRILIKSFSAVLCLSLANQLSAQQNIQVFDQGAQMLSHTYLLPQGWQAEEYRHYNRSIANFNAYISNLYGPNGEIFLTSNPSSYFPAMGHTFDKALGFELNKLLSYFGQFQSGPFRQSQVGYDLFGHALGPGFQIAEIPLRGNVKGKSYGGICIVVFSHGVLTPFVLLSPNKDVSSIARVLKYKDQNTRPNPAYAQMVQMAANQRTANHHSNMAMREQQFQQHQMLMKQMAASRSQQNAAWNNETFGPHSNPSIAGKTVAENMNEYITERTSVIDPHTGEEMKLNGNFANYYKRPDGTYLGTHKPLQNLPYGFVPVQIRR